MLHHLVNLDGDHDVHAVRIYEGAPDNLPDETAESAALEILRLVEDAGEDELIVTLISGGGSALLPCPVSGVSLEEKRQVPFGQLLSSVCLHNHSTELPFLLLQIYVTCS